MPENQRKIYHLVKELKLICQEHGLSQHKLAEISNISRQSIDAWMEGFRNPNIINFDKALHSVGYHLKIVKDENKTTIEDVADQWCCDNCVYYENCNGSRSDCVEHARRYWADE